jgi:pyruvate,water dikinase
VTTRIGKLRKAARNAVPDAYDRLGRGQVAVHSSATAGNRAEASLAGQHDTFLNLDGEEQLLTARPLTEIGDFIAA